MKEKGLELMVLLNHYPDFIIQTKSGKTILLETKGDHLDAEQKIRLGDFGLVKQETIIVTSWFMKDEQLMEHINWKTL